MSRIGRAVGILGAAVITLGFLPVSGWMGASGFAGTASAACPCNIWPGPVTPGFAYDDPTPIEMGLKFRSDIPGYVTGVRFFKAAGATGTHIGRLWTTGGVKLAEVTFAGESASGWQTATFPTAPYIQANTTYIISYYVGDGNKRFSDTFDFFAASGVDNAPLHALADGVDGPNGLFSDDGGWFNKTFRSSNYWVDLVFDDSPPAPDQTPPTVAAVVPANGASGVLRTSSVSAMFDEAMDGATISAATVELRDPLNNLVPASVSYAPGTYAAVLAPAADLAYNTTYTARVKSGSSGVKDLAGNALVADYTWSFTTEAPDITPPTVSSVMPIHGTTRLRPETRATARFSEALDPATLTAATFELLDPSNNPVSATVAYDAGTFTATLTPGSLLTRGTTYTARVKGGASGVKDAFGNPLTTDRTWSFSTAATRPPVDQAPGGPILVIASSANLYTRYFTEILRAEGLNEFDIADISQVTTGMLATHDVVILGDMALSAGQVSLLTDWVTGGGHLVAMHPDKQLAGLLGLTDAASTLSNGYLLIDTSQNPGTGIVGQTLQFHGAADAYTLSGASALATLYSDRTTQTAYPAVTLRSVGANGGVACAFTFDLAKSIVWTHQGNPAWQIDHVNPQQSYGTALDLFYPDWIDFNRITIPQADEQQRFLANLILYTNTPKRPLPRFWYLPKGKKAAIILTGDDHWGISTPSGQTKTFFDRHKQLSTPGCSPEDWECIRSSSYGFEGCLLTDQEAADYTAQGFELGLHADAGLASGEGWCGAWGSNMPAQYNAQLEPLMLKFASIPVQSSERSHCYSWFGYTGAPGWQGYAGTPEVEANLDIHLDTNISYNPAGWATVNPGYQMGSGMMMRFAQVDNSGAMTKFLDVYNAGTQMNDDNGQGAAAMRTIVDSFLDNAKGPNGFYGGFCVNMHSDNWYGWSYDGSDQIVASAQAHDIPVVSGRQMLDWLDGRNGSSFGSIAWDGTTMGFSVAVGTGARNLMGMVPSAVGLVPLNTLTRDGSPVAFTVETIKGRGYAFFPATAGTYAAVYTPDTTPPVITAVTADPLSGTSASIQWTTNEPATSRVDFGTSSGSLTPSATDPTLVTAHTMQLSGLLPNTLYYYRVVSVDESGNAATSPVTGADPATFTTPAASMFDITAVDFGLGSPDANSYISQTSDGEVILKPAVATEFSGTSLPSGWSVVSGSGPATVSGGVLVLNGVTVGPGGTYTAGHSVEAVATFTATPFEHVGFGVNYSGGGGDAWAMISTGAAGTGLLARCWTGSGGFDTQSTSIPGSFLGTPHRYRVDWNASSVDYYVDGIKVATHNVAISVPMRPLLSVGSVNQGSLTVDWLRMSPYPSPGEFTSRLFDARGPAAWQGLSWTSDVPSGTTLSMSVRTGNAPDTGDPSWTAFSTIPNSGGAIGATSRYVQYRATLSTTDPAITPVLRDVSLHYNQDQVPPPAITAVTANPTSAATATISWSTDEPATGRVDYGTSAGSLPMNTSDAAMVMQHTLNLTGLLPNSTYHYRVTSADAAGNSSTSPATGTDPATFTTPPLNLFDTSVADFGAGTPDANVYISQVTDGEVILKPTLATEFSGSSLPAGWSMMAGSGTATVSNGVITLNGATVGPAGTYSAGRSVDAVATFTAGIHQHVGFGVTLTALAGDAWAIISTGASGTGLLARCWTGSGGFDTQSTPITGSFLGSPHRYRVDWHTNSIDYYVDGVLVATHNVTISTPMRPLVSVGPIDATPLTVDWLHMSPCASSGVFTSRVFDAGAPAAWQGMAWSSDVPGGTTLAMAARTGNAPAPDGSWSSFTPIASSGGPVPGVSRYVQYQATLSTGDPTQSPTLRDVLFTYGVAPPDVVAAVPAPGSCISTAHACVAIPVTFTRSNTTGMRGYSVHVTLGGGLATCGTPFTQGSYLSAAGATTFQVVDNHDGSYDIDEAILGACNGGATGNGTLFTVNVGSATASGTGTVALSNVRVRDCANGPLPGDAGPDASIVIDNTPPAALTALAAARVLTGNPVGQPTTGITVTYAGTVPAGGHVEVWRKRFGNYPEYDDGATPGSAPSLPASYPPAGWTPTAVTASGQVDAPGSRDFWYYVAYTVDACGNAAASGMTAGALDYVLGDVHDGNADCAGDNRVSTSDVSYLGAHYGATLGEPDALSCLDVGPTNTGYVDGRPLTDNHVDFEDLVLFAIDYETAGGPALMARAARSRPAAASADALTLAVGTVPAVGETFEALLSLAGAGDVQALSAKLDYDAAVVEPVKVTRGELLAQQAGPAEVFTPVPGTVDVAAFGQGQGLTGTGELARVTFRVKAPGDPGIGLGKVSARDAHNRPLALDGRSAPGTVEPPPTQVMLAPSYPNPFTSAITVGFGMPKAGMAQLVAFDIQGRAVRHLVDGLVNAGWKRVTWDGRDDAGKTLAPGAYVIRLAVGDRIITKSVRMVR